MLNIRLCLYGLKGYNRVIGKGLRENQLSNKKKKTSNVIDLKKGYNILKFLLKYWCLFSNVLRLLALWFALTLRHGKIYVVQVTELKSKEIF